MQPASDSVINVVFAGLGGQGVLKASDILSAVVFEAGYDVKKSEIHGMSQRGGSVTSDVRFGREVHSPMVPEGEADFLVVLAADQVDNNVHCLAADGVLITPACIDESQLKNKRSINVALLGVLSTHLDVAEAAWRAAIAGSLPENLHEVNFAAFALGRTSTRKGGLPPC